MFFTRTKWCESNSARIGVGLLLFLPLAACAEDEAAGDTRAQGESTTLRLGTILSPQHPFVRCGAETLASEIASKDVGLEVEIVDSAQLGSENEMLQQVATGQLEINVAATSTIASEFDFDELALFEAYYLYESVDDAFEVYGSEVAQELLDELPSRANMRSVGDPWLYGERHIFSNRPLREPEDFEGLRLRVPETDISIDSASALGTQPTPVPFAELYLALEQGIVDAMEQSLSAAEAESFDEPTDYVNLTAHLVSIIPVLINDDVWNGLSGEQQTAFIEATTVAAESVRECVEEEDAAALQKWRDDGEVEVVEDVNLEELRDKVRDHFSSGYAFSDQYNELVSD